ncbi:MAG: DUF397 domain-containing protein [Pseudonocardia sp.]
MPDLNHLTWRKSTYSNNGGNCVEVGAAWRKSTYSGNGGDCVEVAGDPLDDRGVVLVRDSKDPDGPVITFRPDQFATFLHQAIHGRLDDTDGAVEIIRHDRDVLVAGRRVHTSWHLRSRTAPVTLHFTTSEWTAFQKGAEHGEFGTAARREPLLT